MVDYFASGVIAALPKLCGFSPKVTAILESSALTAGAYSMMTDYERGLVKLLPMKAHLTLDALSGGALLGAAMLLDDEDTATRATLAGIGLFEIAAALTTEPESTTERTKRRRNPRSGGKGRSRGRGRGRGRALAHA
jgi:hypothetical protein